MGSAIIAHSSLVHARNLINSDDLYFLVFEKNRESIELLDIIPRDHIITIPDGSLTSFALGAVRALRQVRSFGIDTVVDFELFSRFTALFSYASGASRRIGFHNYTAEGLYRGSLLTHPVFYNPHQHMARNFLGLVKAIESNGTERPLLKSRVDDLLLPLPVFKPTDADRSHVLGMLRSKQPNFREGAKIVVINPDPGEALPIRGWPREYFVETVRGLAEADRSCFFVIVGLARSKPYAEALRAAVPADRFVDLTGETKTLAQVVTLFTMSDILFGNDSGPAHFAALTSIHIVTIFGPETPALYSPVSPRAINIFSEYACSPCLSAHNHRHTICKRSDCLIAIKPEEVLPVMLDLLKRGSFSDSLRIARRFNVGTTVSAA